METNKQTFISVYVPPPSEWLHVHTNDPTESILPSGFLGSSHMRFSYDFLSHIVFPCKVAHGNFQDLHLQPLVSSPDLFILHSPSLPLPNGTWNPALCSTSPMLWPVLLALISDLLLTWSPLSAEHWTAACVDFCPSTVKIWISIECISKFVYSPQTFSPLASHYPGNMQHNLLIV